MSGPAFTLHTGLGLPALGEHWRALQARAAPRFFLSWSWIGAWLETLGTIPPVLEGRIDGQTVLLGVVVPRHRVEAGLIRVHGAMLHTTGDRARDVIAVEYNGFLVDRTHEGRIEAAAVAFLLGPARLAGRRCDELHIVATVAAAEAWLVPPGMLVQRPARKPSWRVDLAAVRAAGGDFPALLSANTRQQLRRALRGYAARGPLAVTPAADAATALGWLDALAALHQAQWKARGEPGGWAFPFFARFQRRLVAAGVPEGRVELLRVTAEGQELGYLLNLIEGDHVMAFVSGFRFDPDPRLKPGLVCHALAIARHAEAGRAVYDFLAGAARYKASLGRPGPEFAYLLIQRPTLMTRAEHALRRLLRRRAGGDQAIEASTGASAASRAAG